MIFSLSSNSKYCKSSGGALIAAAYKKKFSSPYLLVRSQQLKHQNNVSNLIKVNTKEVRKMSPGIPLLNESKSVETGSFCTVYFKLGVIHNVRTLRFYTLSILYVHIGF